MREQRRDKGRVLLHQNYRIEEKSLFKFSFWVKISWSSVSLIKDSWTLKPASSFPLFECCDLVWKHAKSTHMWCHSLRNSQQLDRITETGCKTGAFLSCFSLQPSALPVIQHLQWGAAAWGGKTHLLVRLRGRNHTDTDSNRHDARMHGEKSLRLK